MAEKTIVVNLPYGLAPNTLPGMSGYRFVPSHVGSADGEQVFARVAANNPGISAAIARLVHETKCGVVADVIANVRSRGDAALLEYNEKFEKAKKAGGN